MGKISKVIARQVFDSRGNPTIETEVKLSDGSTSSAIIPSGASTGTHEAFELRDLDNKNYLGKSVFKVIEKVNGEISKALIGLQAEDLKKIDNKTPLEISQTPNLDNMVLNGYSGLMQTLYEDLPKGSIVSQMGILGFDTYKYYPNGRASCEALGGLLGLLNGSWWCPDPVSTLAETKLVGRFNILRNY